MKNLKRILTKVSAFTCIVASLTCITLVSAATSTKQSKPITIKTALTKGKTVSKVKLSKGVLNFTKDIPAKPAASLYFDPEKTYDVVLTNEELIKYFGREFRSSYVPEGLKESDSGNAWYLKKNNDGTFAYDVVNVLYGEGNEDFLNPHRKELHVKVSKGKLPITCVILTSDTTINSDINGVEIGVGYLKQGYNYDNNGKPEGYTDVYMAEFLYKGIGYEITSNNISQEEFIKVLLSIIK